jgi:cytoskeletal protein CcmA (bactofilin family)
MEDADLTYPQEGLAIDARKLRVSGAVRLNGEFTSTGRVDLTGGRVDGNFYASGGRFFRAGGAGTNERVLDLTRVFIGQNAYLDRGFHAKGTVRLLDAHIKGSLRCEGARFENDADTAIYAAGLKVDRDVKLTKDQSERQRDNRAFKAEGKVIFCDATVTGTMDLSGGSFASGQSSSLDVSGLTVGSLIFGDEFRVTGTLDLKRVHVTGRFSVGAATHASQVQLKGLTYRSFEDVMDLKSRLEWLKGAQTPFEPQVYRQLAAYYKASGDTAGAKKVLIAGRDARYSTRHWSVRALAWLFKQSVGYGYRPQLVLFWIACLEVIGGVLFSILRGEILLAPTYIFESATESRPKGTITGAYSATIPGYPAFQPWLYTLDLLMPVVDFRQSDFWIPHHAAEWFSTAFIISGWALATALVIGLGSVFTRDREDSNSLGL